MFPFGVRNKGTSIPYLERDKKLKETTYTKLLLIEDRKTMTYYCLKSAYPNKILSLYKIFPWSLENVSIKYLLKN